VHRGPDGAGSFVDDGVALVHTRLALVDVSGGAQPLRSPDGRYALIVNGELYGHRARLKHLEARGAQPQTRSDGEVLLWTLILDGPAGLDAVVGEYAFCFWDGRTRQAIVGRDVLGVKPLVWANDDDGAFVFASELKALRQGLHARARLCEQTLAQTFVCPPLSGRDALPVAGARSLPAGAVAVVVEGADGAGDLRLLRRRRHHAFSGEGPKASPAQLADALRAAVADRCDADVQVGALWSGGLDSTAILALSPPAEHGRHTYSLRLDDGAVGHGGDSIVVDDDAAVVAAHVDDFTIAHHWVCASRDALLDDLEGLFASQDRVVAWEQELSQRALARRARTDVKAVLVGDAADETHAGYPFALLPPTVTHPAAFLRRFGAGLRTSLLRPTLRDAADAVVDDCLAVAADAGAAFDADLGTQRRGMSAVILERWLPRLLHNGDVHTMAFGLEARVPFADERVLAVAQGVAIDDAFCDARGLVDGCGPEKRFLKAALAGVVPPAIVARAKSALPRDERLGPAYRAVLQRRLADPQHALATIFDIDALRALSSQTHVVDDGERMALFSVLAVDGYLRHHLNHSRDS
jgi:asparagine synthase (glutamine-hydrolysing)